MGYQAAVVGASGYAGGELLRLLAAHPDVEVGTLVAGTRAGERLGTVHPQLSSLANRTLVSLDAADLTGHDVIFLALPHGQSGSIARDLPDAAVVVDLGADFRLADPADWNRWYAGAHAGQWVYGLPELPDARQQLAGQRRIANPGCYATAVALSYAPLLAAGLIESQDLVVVAASGTSGAGRSPKDNLLATQVMGDLSPYKVAGSHQHLGEIRQALDGIAEALVSISFTPVLAPMPRGILATCTARLAPGADESAVRQAVAAAYEDEPFVHLLPEGHWPHTAATLGSNSAQLQLAVDEDPGRVVILTVIDNLGKGAAGQAIQNANAALGLPETTGLPVDGVAP